MATTTDPRTIEPPELGAERVERIQARFGVELVEVRWSDDDGGWVVQAVRPNGWRYDVAWWCDARVPSARKRAPRQPKWELVYAGRNGCWYDPAA